MKILAIETATIEVGVAVGDETGPIATSTSRPGRRQVETLHPAIAEVCGRAGIALDELGAVAVDVGPGLFTGLRVGVAAAKALAGGLGVPMATATSLDVLAASCPGSFGSVVPVIDMRRGEVAWQMPGSSGAFSVGSPLKLACELDELVGPVLLVGDGAIRYKAELAGSPGAQRAFAGPELAAAPVASLVVLAMAAAKTGKLLDPSQVRPSYGREADARINWSSREARSEVGS